MLYSVPLLLSALLLMPAFSVQAEPVPVARQALETKDVAITQRNADLAIDIHYPVTGYPDVDRDIKDWAEQQAQAFKLTSAEPHTNPYELSTSYVLTSPSARYLSLVWEIFTYTGGAHSNLEITTFTYATGDRQDRGSLRRLRRSRSGARAGQRLFREKTGKHAGGHGGCGNDSGRDDSRCGKLFPVRPDTSRHPLLFSALSGGAVGGGHADGGHSSRRACPGQASAGSVGALMPAGYRTIHPR